MMIAQQSLGPQRSFGQASVDFVQRSGVTSLSNLRQVGSAKAFLPKVDGLVPEVVFLNTSGGLTSGDQLSYKINLAPQCRVVATTQTSERCYRADTGYGVVEVEMHVGTAGRLDWLPQETIVYNNAKLARRTDIHLGTDAGCLFVETIILGRLAMGETLDAVDLRDTRSVYRMGRLAYTEPFALTTATLDARYGAALLGEARAFASVIFVANGAQDAVQTLRPLLTTPGVDAAASGFDGKCILRLAAADGWPLRQQLLRILGPLLGRAPPRVWQM
jgi:urease accessory protein